MKYKELFVVAEIHCTDEFAETDTDLIVVPLTKEYVQSVLAKIELAKAHKATDDTFYSLEFFDYHPWHFSRDDRFADLTDLEGRSVMEDVLAQYGTFALVAKLPVTDEDRTILDVPTVVVRPDGVEFQAALKNTSIYVNSPDISAEALRQIDALLE